MERWRFCTETRGVMDGAMRGRWTGDERCQVLSIRTKRGSRFPASSLFLFDLISSECERNRFQLILDESRSEARGAVCV